MPITQTKGITVKIDAVLHAEIKAYLEQNEMTMSEFIALAAQDELHPKIQQEVHTMAENTRTLAFQVPESLFQRIKDYLARYQMTQRAFVIGLIEKELDREEELLRQQEQTGAAEEEQEDGPVEAAAPDFVPTDEQAEHDPDQEETPVMGDFEGVSDEPGEEQDEGFSVDGLPDSAPADILDEYAPGQDETAAVGGFEGGSDEPAEEPGEDFSENEASDFSPEDGQYEYDPEQEEGQDMGSSDSPIEEQNIEEAQEGYVGMSM